MRELNIIQLPDLRQYAQSHQLELVDLTDHQPLVFDVPPVRTILGGQVYWLAPLNLRNFGRFAIKFREAIVRGRNLATIHGNALLPSGYSHSFNWVEQGGFTLAPDRTTCYWPATSCHDLEDGAETYVLGTVTHFGHFFTDCLDRVLAVEHLGATQAARFLIDGAPPAQVRQIIGLLGLNLSESHLLMVDPTVDYRVRNLRLLTLGSVKPAISASSFRTLRERVLAQVPHSGPAAGSVYVGRKGVRKRRLVNQDDMERDLSALNFRVFYPEMNDLEETVKTFHGADVVVIVIGSSKFNLAFCRPGTRIICLAPQGYAEQSGAVAVMLRQICGLFQLELCFCSCQIAGTNLGLDSDLIADSRDLNLALRTLRV